MKCLVCQATRADDAGSVCPQCNYDVSAPEARDPARIQQARQAFRDKTTAYAPGSRVTARDRWQPWVALALGFAIFIVWLRACSSGGFRLW